MRITSKGQVTIPQAVREQAGLVPGTDVDFVVEKGEVRLVRTGRASKATRGELAVQRFAGTAQTRLSTDELMKMLRGWDEEPPGVLD